MTSFFVAAHAFIQKDGKFLVTKRMATDSYMPGVWDLPGGTVEAGETIEKALIREVTEETGLVVRIGTPISVYTTLSQLPTRQNVTIIFACDWVSGDVVLTEHDEFCWVARDELAKLECIHFLAHLSFLLPLLSRR